MAELTNVLDETVPRIELSARQLRKIQSSLSISVEEEHVNVMDSTTSKLSGYISSKNPVLAKFSRLLHQQVDGKATYPTSVVEDILVPGPVRWGGKVGRTHLTNTCPVDNFLTVILACLLNNPAIEVMLTEDEFSVTLASAIQLIKEGEDAEAKVLWGTYIGSCKYSQLPWFSV